jgi:hypothetical protein
MVRTSEYGWWCWLPLNLMPLNHTLKMVNTVNFILHKIHHRPKRWIENCSICSPFGSRYSLNVKNSPHGLMCGAIWGVGRKFGRLDLVGGSRSLEGVPLKVILTLASFCLTFCFLTPMRCATLLHHTPLP